MGDRALHGVNLTGWLTLEPWVTPSLFADSGTLEEAALAQALGRRRYAEAVRHHRATFLSQSDFVQIAARGFNAVRLVVPWYWLGSDGPDAGPFRGCVREVDEAMDWADEIDLKVILALGLAPGAEGVAASLVRNHDDFAHYRDDMVAVVGALAKRYGTRQALAGIELADAPKGQTRRGLALTDGVPLHLLRNYYRDAYDAVRANAGNDLVVVMPDAGCHDAWGRFMAQRHYRNAWMDCTLYRYLDQVGPTGPLGVRQLAQRSSAELAQLAKSGLPVMVGKWSGSLPYADSATTPEGSIALERVFLSEQIEAFSSCPAWFFQTWKTEGRLRGWDARISLASFERRMLA